MFPAYSVEARAPGVFSSSSGLSENLTWVGCAVHGVQG